MESARELKEYLIRTLNEELSKIHLMNEQMCSIEETSQYRGRIQQCRSLLKTLEKL